MPDLLCPFSAPLVKKDFACSHAQEIIRRGGAEIACQQLAAHSVCKLLHSTIKLSSLAAMDLEDDLLSLPHNVLVKIQYGGLRGLQNLVAAGVGDNHQVADIATLVAAATAKYSSVQNIPLESINETISDYKVARRRKL